MDFTDRLDMMDDDCDIEGYPIDYACPLEIKPMKAITLWQPWAQLSVLGEKKFETRSWSTNVRGRVAIHAAKKNPHDLYKILPKDVATVIFNALDPYGHNPNRYSKPLPLGAIVGTVEIVCCWEIHRNNGRGASIKDVFIDKYNPKDKDGITFISNKEYQLGDYTPGRFAWELKDPIMFDKPIPAIGRQGFFTWDGVL